MQQFTIHIPDNKIDFFTDLVANLGFTIETSIQKNVLTEKQIDLVNDARKQITENPDRFIDWEEARKTLNVE